MTMNTVEVRGDIFEVILDILAITVLLDQKERDQELLEFCHFAQRHNRDLRPDQILSRTKLQHWFMGRREALIAELQSDKSDRYKISLLDQVETQDLQKRVIASIFAIAICDYDFHAAEMQFIQLSLSRWQLSLPEQEAYDLTTV